MLEQVPVWLGMLEQILVWREGFGHGAQVLLMEQVPEWDVGAGSLLAGGGGAWCIPGGLGCWYWSGWVWWRGHPFVGMMDKEPVCRVGEIEQGPVGWG